MTGHPCLGNGLWGTSRIPIGFSGGETMKKLLIASAIVATFVTPQAFAQAKNFEGFSVLGGVNLVSGTTEVTSTVFNGSASESSQNLGLQAQYNFALGESFVLGLGANIGLGDLKAGVLSNGTTN
eukprot:gene40002-63812_t